uniref:Dscam7 n=1 Tax=Olivierus martensii TaxID=34649 RepID=A0A510A1F7_OLIMR|nr:Dscam7 [Mesobuthus martensii]
MAASCTALTSTAKNLWILLSYLYTYHHVLGFTSNKDYTGPYFITEPPSRVVFLSTQGITIACSVNGNPKPLVIWKKKSGSTVENIPGLLHVRPDGSLNFPPFSDDHYRSDIHSATYRCVSSNIAGTIGSRDVEVKAVTPQTYDIVVYDNHVPLGNTGVLKCHIPALGSHILEHVGWLTDDGLTLLTQKEHAFRSGTLHVFNVERKDGERRYRCQVENRLTGEKILSSNWGRLKISESPANVVPRIIQEVSTTETTDGYTARIPCIAHGKVPISYKWYRNVGGQLTPVDSKKGIEISEGTLVIPKANMMDTGKYTCVANNSLGEDRIEATLVVRGTLKVAIESTRRIVRSGEDIVLNCNVSGSPIISVSWLKDQHHLVSDHRVRLSTATTLHIAAFQRKDSGIYQCYVENDWESAQAAIQLDLQEQSPSFIRVFPEQRHRDGQFVSLQCEAIGSPIPQIDWTLDGENLPESRRVQFGDFVRRDGSIISYVNLTELSTVEGGLYGCIAHNDVGTVSHSARIEVFGPPFIRPLKNVTAVAGQIVKLRCSVSGYPIDFVYVEKDGQRLPIGDRQTQEQRGIITLHNIRKDDEGVYKCVALNNRGEKAERSFVLQVVTAPVISPFLFTDKLEEGMRNSAVCTILAGDPPVRITWYKDGIPIRDVYPDIQVVSITDFVSSLIINTVKRHHTGNYTCVASNAATSVNYTARMVVRASPKWTIKPTDQSALAGMPVTFDCQADGEPKPVVRWKYSPDGERKEYHSVLSSSRIYVLENGSLTITAAEKTDIGYYMCETSNDVGEPLREDIQLTVHSAPQIQSSTQVVQVKKSERATLSCSASGDPPLTINWNKVGFPLALYQIKRYTIEESERADIKTSLVTISHAEREDTNTYTCLASNPYGIQKTEVRLIVQEPPDPPEDVRVIEVTSTAASLLWSPPYSGNSPITSYVVSYKQEKEEWPSNRSGRVIVSSADTTATITGLQSMTSYNIHVFARNSIGHSSPSETITVITAAEAPRNPPINVKAVPLDSKSVKVTWQVPFRSDRVKVEDFYVGYKESESTKQYIYKTVHVNKDQVIAEYIITNLKRSTKYAIVVQAFNSQGAGPASEEVIVQTFLMDPPKAPVLHIVGTTSNTISLKWETSEDSSNPINGYILNYKGNTNEWKEIQLSSNHYHYTLENLLCGTLYELLLIAFNDVGRGNPSETLQDSTKGRAPVSPDENIFLKVNVSSVQLRLSTWADDGCPISHFVVRYKPRGQREWILVSNHILPEQDVVMIADLSPGTWHDLLITAHNDAGITEKEYSFATLTLQGGTIPPPTTVKHFIFLEDPAILVPIICTMVVLVVIISVTTFVVVWKRRESGGDVSSDLYSRNSGGRADDISMSSYGKAKGNSVYDAQREPLYYPLPYATTHIPTSQSESRNLESPECLRPNKSRTTEHTYDVPHRVQRRPENIPHQYSRLWTNSRDNSDKQPNIDVTIKELDEYSGDLSLNEKYHRYGQSNTRIPSVISSENLNYQRYFEESCPMSPYEESLAPEEFSETECDRDRSANIYALSSSLCQQSPAIVY